MFWYCRERFGFLALSVTLQALGAAGIVCNDLCRQQREQVLCAMIQSSSNVCVCANLYSGAVFNTGTPKTVALNAFLRALDCK